MSPLLEPGQEELLSRLVEAFRNAPREQRQKFVVVSVLNGPTRVLHPGLPGGSLDWYRGDVEALAREGFLAASYGPRGIDQFDVTRYGMAYYEEMKYRTGQPLQQVQQETRFYLDAEPFRRLYSAAYGKWSQAERLLWSSETEPQLTTIGHLCREAMQEFATTLVEHFQPPDVDSDKSKDIKRIAAVLAHQSGQLGATERSLLEALLNYWAKVSALVQRQEHGGQREGTPLVWEDARRVVFQTAVVMFEVDRSLQ